MSEQLHALLLRLYPPELQREYGREALQLICDRWRDERGIALRLRLCLDLAADLLMTTLRSRQRIEPLMPAGSASARAPLFHIVEPTSLRPEALAVGVLLSIFMIATFARLMPLEPDHVLTTLDSLVGRRSLRLQSSQPTAVADSVDSATRRKVIVAVASSLEHYPNPMIARTLADAVLAHDKNGDYDAAVTGPALADRLTQHIRETSRAAGIVAGEFVGEVIFSPRTLPHAPPSSTPMTRPPGAVDEYRAAMVRQNCQIETINTLPHNIGYVKLNGFPDRSVCQAITSAAMVSVNNADALILDLRDNAGGFGDTAMWIAAHLFDHPVYLFDPRQNTTVQNWTPSPISDSKLARVPVFVLTSSATFSAAEYFAYNLKMLRRATIVGETTRGGQHSGVFQRIDDHFGVAVQEVAPLNPFPVKGWELIGVEPDVKVPRQEAVDVARKLAESRR